ncbi:MAG: hypothetical protein L0Z50_11335 [Verrucomicrobiales bacterium]|nr:hypothetical protein [Verrucomicrobiales bacterium]
MSSLLILTVGTGTAGKHSDVAQGLANTIRQVRPRRFWLVPSASAKSTPVADLIRETVADLESFAPWSESAPYHAIPNHDDIHECRRLVREVIAAAKRELRPEELLVVNPTSGTKQMSAGATLAALDEEVDQIDFTSGERVDGVVKTGTEVVQSFDLRGFLLQRDLRTANELFHHGAFYAIARLLKGYAQTEALRAREIALCLHEWQRMNYAKAASHAAKFSEELRTHLKTLASADEFSVPVLGDLLAGADELVRWGDCEEALARYYRGAEHAAKVRLADAHSIRPPYRFGTLLNSLPVGCRLGEELRSRSRKGLVQIGADLAWRTLDAVQDPIAASYFADQKLQDGLQRRNESMYGHGKESIDAVEVRAVADRLRNVLREHLPAALACWTTTRRPRSLS